MALFDWQTRSDISLRDPNALGGEVSKGTWTKAGSLDVPTNSVRAFRTTFDKPNGSGSWALQLESIDDDGWIFLNGQKIGETHQWDEPVSIDITSGLQPKGNTLVIVVRNGDGPGGAIDPRLSQNTGGSANSGRIMWTDRFVADGKAESYALATTVLPRLERTKAEPCQAGQQGPLVQSTIRFDVGDTQRWAYEMVLAAGGDGFVTLNGQDLGRYWQVGPQRAFYLPECWLKPKGNVLTLTVRPTGQGDRITGAELRALAK